MKQKATVADPHPAYNIKQAQRDVFHAVLSTDVIRAGGKSYLRPFPNELESDYSARLLAATLDEIVAAGVDSMVGKVFEDPLNTEGVTLDPTWLENIDLEGCTLNTFARQAFEASFDGFSLIMADMPPMSDAQAQLAAERGAEADRMLQRRPFLRLYTAANVTNWHYETNPVTNRKELTLLVLREMSSQLDGFDHVEVERYRVLRYVNGFVGWELWESEQVNGEKTWSVVASGLFDGVTEIPVAFIGKITDAPKLLGEARLEIKGYAKESSYDTIEIMAVPVFYTRGYPGDQPSPSLGASCHLRLPADLAAEAGFIQIDSAGLTTLKDSIGTIKDTIRQRLAQMADVHRTVEVTATESANSAKDSRARLVVWAEELKDAINLALQFMGQFAGLGEDNAGVVELRTAWQKAEEIAQRDQTIVVDNPNNQ